MRRRDFLVGAMVTAGAYAGQRQAGAKPMRNSLRPPRSKRHFVSKAVDSLVRDVSRYVGDPELAWMFENCFPNPLDTTVDFSDAGGRPDTFVITGDIPAMWLRDTMHQMWPYLSLAKKDKHLQLMLKGVIHRMVECIMISPYAEAFLKSPRDKSIWVSDHTHMAPGVWEHKWEVDSICAVIRFSHGYWVATGDTTPFDAAWLEAMKRIVKTLQTQQRIHGPGPYRFQRDALNSTDTLPRGGIGFPANPIGLVFTMFRPSDDAVIYPLHIPDNLMAERELKHLAQILRAIHADAEQVRVCDTFSNLLETTINHHGIIPQSPADSVYAYEIDGYGNAVLMDDANWPGVLSLPWFRACSATDATYLASRRRVWSEQNPYFYRGKFEGIGSIHTPVGNIWPMSLIMYGLTAVKESEVAWALKALKNSSAGTGFIHESFDRNDPTKFTRSWFAMANAMFGELVVQTLHRFPHVLSGRL
jgi:meiotically up-regulated gene 157 (Mug157) protein